MGVVDAARHRSAGWLPCARPLICVYATSRHVSCQTRLEDCPCGSGREAQEGRVRQKAEAPSKSAVHAGIQTRTRRSRRTDMDDACCVPRLTKRCSLVLRRWSPPLVRAAHHLGLMTLPSNLLESCATWCAED